MDPPVKRSRVRMCASRCNSDTVVFNVGGKYFEIFKYRIQAQPSTMLASLIDDISTDDEVPIFVDSCPKRFGHILDWYRYGEMFVPQHCSMEAVLRDACFFMLPECIKINGAMQVVSAPSNQPMHSAENSHTQLRAEIVSKWPGFEAYVEKLAKEVSELVVNQGTDSDEVLPLHVPDGDWLNDISLNPELQMSWHKVQVAKCGRDRGNTPICEWIDNDNICNLERMKILIQELRMRGFECNVHHYDYEILLAIGVPPCKGKPVQDVRLHGVNLIPRGRYKALVVHQM